MRITIKRDEALKELASLAHKNHIELAKHIIDKAIEARVISDNKEFCGENLFEIFFDNGYNLIATTLFCLGKCDPFLMQNFRNLTVWGMHDDCPECGFDMEFIDGEDHGKYKWHERECLNCGKRVSNEPNWDSVPGGHDYNN
jgi:hypothetical protein